MIAAKEGAMTIFHFRTALDSVNALIQASPTILWRVDRTARKEANKIFPSCFRDFGDVRNSMAHSAEVSSPKHIKKHFAPVSQLPNEFVETPSGEGDQTIFLSNGLFGRRLTATFNGRVVSYEISDLSLECLRATAQTVFDSLEEAAAFTREQAWKALRRPT